MAIRNPFNINSNNRMGLGYGGGVTDIPVGAEEPLTAPTGIDAGLPTMEGIGGGGSTTTGGGEGFGVMGGLQTLFGLAQIGSSIWAALEEKKMREKELERMYPKQTAAQAADQAQMGQRFENPFSPTGGLKPGQQIMQKLQQVRQMAAQKGGNQQAYTRYKG